MHRVPHLGNLQTLASRSNRRAALALSWLLITALIVAPSHASPSPAPALNLSLTCPSGDPMWMSSKPRPPLFGVIIQFLSQAAAQQRIKATEQRNGGRIDPNYTNNQRVIVQFAHGRKMGVLVPNLMTVHLGEAVLVTPAHADPNNLCLYTPNLIIP